MRCQGLFAMPVPQESIKLAWEAAVFLAQHHLIRPAQHLLLVQTAPLGRLPLTQELRLAAIAFIVMLGITILQTPVSPVLLEAIPCMETQPVLVAAQEPISHCQAQEIVLMPQQAHMLILLQLFLILIVQLEPITLIWDPNLLAVALAAHLELLQLQALLSAQIVCLDTMHHLAQRLAVFVLQALILQPWLHLARFALLVRQVL